MHNQVRRTGCSVFMSMFDPFIPRYLSDACFMKVPHCGDHPVESVKSLLSVSQTRRRRRMTGRSALLGDNGVRMASVGRHGHHCTVVRLTAGRRRVPGRRGLELGRALCRLKGDGASCGGAGPRCSPWPGSQAGSWEGGKGASRVGTLEGQSPGVCRTEDSPTSIQMTKAH